MFSSPQCIAYSHAMGMIKVVSWLPSWPTRGDALTRVVRDGQRCASVDADIGKDGPAINSDQ